MNRTIESHALLADLDVLAERLIAVYPCWPKLLASVFVLTGATPHVPAVLSSVIWFTPDVEGAARIEMSIDPTTDPKAVARAYQEARRPRLRDGKARVKPLEPKNRQLASFLALRPHSIDADGKIVWGESLGEQMEAWNATVDEWGLPGAGEKPAVGQKDNWKYRREETFGRDRARVTSILQEGVIARPTPEEVEDRG